MPNTLAHYAFVAAQLLSAVVAAASTALAVGHFVVEPLLDVWAPREECPRLRAAYDKVLKSLVIISASTQRARRAR